MHCFMQRGEASEPAVTDCNLTVPIATLGANRDSQELLLHPDFPGLGHAVDIGRASSPFSASKTSPSRLP
jgi:hypothetical protein